MLPVIYYKNVYFTIALQVYKKNWYMYINDWWIVIIIYTLQLLIHLYQSFIRVEDSLIFFKCFSLPFLI